MGKDTSVVDSAENQIPELEAGKASVTDTGAALDKHNTQGVLDTFKEKAHEAADTLKWQAEEVREGFHRRHSLDRTAARSLSSLPEESVLAPVPEDAFVLVKADSPTGEIPPLVPVPEVDADLLPREKVPVISLVSMNTDDDKKNVPVAPTPFTDRAYGAMLTLEQVGHSARLKIENVLETQFGERAEKIQNELEKARVSAIAGTARFVEVLQSQFRKAATSFRQERPSAAAAVFVHPPPFVVALPVDVAPKESETLETKQHKPHLEIDTTGEPEPEPLLEETARERSISESVRIAQSLEGRLGRAASTLREQERHGIAPVYRSGSTSKM